MTSAPTPAALPIGVTLTAAEWSVIRQLVGRGAHDDVAPILAKMDGQFRLAAQRHQAAAAEAS